MKKTTQACVVTAIAMGGVVAEAGGLKYKTDEGYLKLGGRVQVQYHQEDGKDTDDLFFRRLRPYIEGSLNPDWKAKWQWDMGKSKTEIKDAYFMFGGWDVADVYVGNRVFPFSRELLTSSKKQATVERNFAGDHNYGAVDRQVGLHLDSKGESFSWAAAAAMGAIDPSNSKLDFDSVASLNNGGDFNEGPMVGARVEIHPMGPIKFAQGALSGEEELKASLAFAAFTWSNDDDIVNVDVDEETGAESRADSDVDGVTGFEVAGAVRVAGLSLDIQYNSFDSETVVAGVTDGIYKDGETTLEAFAIEAGYTIVPKTVEAVVGYSTLDADGYDETWNRTEFGLNYYVDKHDVKYQVTYRINENQKGKDGADVDEIFAQAQFVF